MKRVLLAMAFALLSFCGLQAQQATNALKQMAALLENSNGAVFVFSLKATHFGEQIGEVDGVLKMKGEKFQLKTDESIVWYNGKTQWTYLIPSDEVNISSPEDDELQTVNPMNLLALSQSGFDVKEGDLKMFKGESITETLLVPKHGVHSDILHVMLYISKKSYKPLYMQVNWRDGTENRIFVNRCEVGADLDENTFVFDIQEYPTAEIIDLR